MKFSRNQPHARFAEFQKVLVMPPAWLQQWTGTFFRFQTIDFPAAKDVLGGSEAPTVVDRTGGGEASAP